MYQIDSWGVEFDVEFSVEGLGDRECVVEHPLIARLFDDYSLVHHFTPYGLMIKAP